MTSLGSSSSSDGWVSVDRSLAEKNDIIAGVLPKFGGNALFKRIWVPPSERSSRNPNDMAKLKKIMHSIGLQPRLKRNYRQLMLA